MTTLNPIDIDKPSLECVALIDLENIRLSWQRTYSKVFEYPDLVLLCGLTEKLMDSRMSRIVVFATDPTEYKGRQVQLTANRLGLLQGGLNNRNLSEYEVRVLNEELMRRKVSLSEDVDAGFRLINSLAEDATLSLHTQSPSAARRKTSSDPNISVAAAPIRNRKSCPANPFNPPVPIATAAIADRKVEEDAMSSLSSVSQCSSAVSEVHIRPVVADGGAESSDDCEIIPATSSDDADEVVYLGSSAGDSALAEDEKHQNGTRKKRARSVGADDRPQTLTTNKKFAAAPSKALQQPKSFHVRLSDKGRKVELRLYGFKVAKGRAVQRGCDVALSAELTKTCFHPNVDKIVLFSADSDFQEVMHNSLEAENIGGVLKYAKTTWVCGFRQAFNQANIRALRTHNNARPGRILGGAGGGGRTHRGPNRGVIVNGNLNYVVIDEVFPQIRHDLEMNRAKRIRWAPPHYCIEHAHP